MGTDTVRERASGGAAERVYGAERTILGSLAARTLIPGAGHLLPARAPGWFFVLAAGIGLVLGGSRALSSSLDSCCSRGYPYAVRCATRATPFRRGFSARRQRAVVYAFGLPGVPLLRVKDAETLGDICRQM